MVMITGDYGLTAESLARRVGMLVGPSPIILTGAEVDGLNDVQLRAALQGEVIFARMAPEHKLRLVATFQALGEVVAVTGDGVNDTPALRKADVGVVMGVTGTDVAKEAADIILTDDNFAQIVTAIEEGRGLYDNLRKFMTYLFSSNVPEVAPFILSALFNIPLALTVMQLLAIDIGTDLLPALALGIERPEPNVMRRPPRRKTQPLIDRFLLRRAYLWLGPIETILCFIGFFAVYAWVGGIEFWTFSLEEWAALPAVLSAMPPAVYALAVTVYHAGVVTAQVGNAYACRTEHEHGWSLGYFTNRTLLWGILAELTIIVLLIYVPPLARLFDHVPLPLYFWPWLLLYAPILYGLEWIRKTLMRRNKRLQPQMGLE
jgi:magnesium-transporting ATPase (P-type)